MKEYIILKNEHGIKKVEGYNLDLNKPYIAVQVPELLTISNIRFIKKTIADRKQIVLDITKMFDSLLLNKDLRDEYMYTVQNCKNNEDVKDFVRMVLSDYKELGKRNIYNKDLRSLDFDSIRDKEVVCNIFLKKFITSFFAVNYMKSSREDLERFVFNQDLDSVLAEKNIRFNENSYNNGIYKLSLLVLDATIKKLLLNQVKHHLCADHCDIETFEKCPKVKYKHQDMEVYKFINEGIQLRTEDENGNITEINRFIVEDCNHSSLAKQKTKRK